MEWMNPMGRKMFLMDGDNTTRTSACATKITSRLLSCWFVHGTLRHPHEPQTGHCRAGAYRGLPDGGDVRHVDRGPAAHHELASLGLGDDGGVRGGHVDSAGAGGVRGQWH